MRTAEQIRPYFEDAVKNSDKLKGNTPLGAMKINGRFHHYIDPDTDTLWIGFAIGFRTAEKLAMTPVKIPTEGQ